MRTKTSIKKNDGAAAETPAPPAAPSFDELMARIDSATAAIAPVDPLAKSLDATAFAAYVSEQIEKASKESAEAAQKRLAALKEVTATARKAFDAGEAAVTFKSFEEPAVVPASAEGAAQSEKPAEVPALEPTVETAKRLLSLSDALSDEKSDLRKALAVEKPEVVAKASAASAMLDKIAAMFGVSRTNDRGEPCSIAWKVSDAIYTLQQAEEADRVMSSLAMTLGVSAEKSEVGKSAGAVDLTGSDFDEKIPVGANANEDGFSHDMSALVVSQKTTTQKAATPVEIPVF